ncbi:aminotransferase class V-fold PLP-dependent enzyme [Carboxylicivirga linearis]|uniref:Cysteine desulfurase n=1 Tax=Carboxylicivirga linearis TaxID=1628157 RepID=A0ABS5JSE1_9BACT|nr:cysteine desulfurase [Carboxylicivirga linearis]MBS2097821.1 cysteine desulfurase [Carboxylicivirga linearis]
MSIDIQKIRKDFPILNQTVYGKPLAYFDNAATAHKPVQVINAIDEVYTKYNSNIHRGVHHLSNVCTQAFEDARIKVQQFVNAPNAHEIIFTRGTTEAINLIASSFGETFLKEGDEIIVSQLEHHSNIVPWQLLEKRKGITLKVIPINDDGELMLDRFEELLSDKTKLVSVAHISNALGTINPIKKIITTAHANNIPVMIDGAQAVQHVKVDVQELDCDFYVFSGHKLYGPTGIGAFYGKEKWLNQMEPYQGGGEMIQTVSFEGTTFNELPFKFEAGTPDYSGAVGLAAAIDYVNNLGLKNIAAYEHELHDYAMKKLSDIPNIQFYGTAKEKASVISFNVGNIHPFDMGTLLDKMGLAVRTGHHCAQPLMQRYNIPGTVRASFAVYNTKEEIDRLVEGVIKVSQLFG